MDRTSAAIAREQDIVLLRCIHCITNDESRVDKNRITSTSDHLTGWAGPCLLPEVCGLPGGEGGGGVRVAIEREHLTGDVLLYETQRPARPLLIDQQEVKEKLKYLPEAV